VLSMPVNSLHNINHIHLSFYVSGRYANLSKTRLPPLSGRICCFVSSYTLFTMMGKLNFYITENELRIPIALTSNDEERK
jgi:hypothetical protein